MPPSQKQLVIYRQDRTYTGEMKKLTEGFLPEFLIYISFVKDLSAYRPAHHKALIHCNFCRSVMFYKSPLVPGMHLLQFSFGMCMKQAFSKEDLCI